jgi:formamidopyrimidine-DNA glycosylase
MLDGFKLLHIKQFLTDKVLGKTLIDIVFFRLSLDSMCQNQFEMIKTYLPCNLTKIETKGHYLFLIFKSCRDDQELYIIQDLYINDDWVNSYDNDCKFFFRFNKKIIWFKSDTTTSCNIHISRHNVIYNLHKNILGVDILTKDFKLNTFLEMLKSESLSEITVFDLLFMTQLICGFGEISIEKSVCKNNLIRLKKIKELTKLERQEIFKNLYVIPRLLYNKVEIDDNIKDKPLLPITL